jgi:hypothetical protein
MSDLIECPIADLIEVGDTGSSLPFLGEFYV